MAESAASPAQVATLQQPPRIKPNQIQITGRCIGVRKAGKSYAHLVVQPAPTPFDHPNTLSVYASNRLAEAESDISVLCQPRGRVRTTQPTVDEFGEKRPGYRVADVTLWAIE